jgi:hypothetical protein
MKSRPVERRLAALEAVERRRFQFIEALGKKQLPRGDLERFILCKPA